MSSEAGSRFDQNITGFRAEEEFGFNAEPYVRTGKFVKILGLWAAVRNHMGRGWRERRHPRHPVRRAHTDPHRLPAVGFSR